MSNNNLIGESSPAMTTPQKLALIKEFRELEPYLSKDERKEVLALLEGIKMPAMSLSEFVRQSFHVVEPHTKYQHNWHIDVICSHLEAASLGLIRNLIINIQPRHMKSLLVSVFWPTWTWTFIPQSQWLCLSYAQNLAIRDNMKRRRIIRSDWYQKRFGGVFEMSSEQRQKSWFENDQGGHMLAQGLGGTGLGGDFIVGDDVLSREHAYSAVRRDFANSVWDETVSTRGNNPKTVVKVIIAQRLHVNDPIGHIMDMERRGGEEYDKLIIPTEYEPENRLKPTTLDWVDPRNKPGQLLWPARYDRGAIEKLKISLDSVGAASQLQQRPTPTKGNIFKHKDLLFWIPKGSELPPVRLKLPDGTTILRPVVEYPDDDQILGQAQSWDMNFKGQAGTSYVVGQVWSWTLANYYLLDQFRDRSDMNEVLEQIRIMTKSYPLATGKYIEEKANGSAVVQLLRDEISGLINIQPYGSKLARANATSPLFRAGNIFFPHPLIAPWITILIDELTKFPNDSYDDQVDATTQFLNEHRTMPAKKPVVKSRVVKRNQVFKFGN